MRKVLYITYDFPLPRTSGIYRPVKFVKHLRDLGWLPIVLTAKNQYSVAQDTTLLNDVPEGTKIVRTYAIDFEAISKHVHNFLFGEKVEQTEQRVNTPKTPSASADQVSQHHEKKNWLKSYFFSPLRVFFQTWVLVPDEKVGWFPTAFTRAFFLVLRERPDVIITTSYPPTTQLIGLFLKYFFRKPWVVDLRDNWVVGYGSNYTSIRRRKLDEWLLGKFLSKADQVVTMCEGNSLDLIQFYDDPHPARYHTITNGYDEADFVHCSEPKAPKEDSRLELLHVGTLYWRTSGKFFDALSELKKEEPEIIKRLNINFIGYLTGIYYELFNELDITDIVNDLGFKKHPETLASMRSADALLLFLGGEKIMNQQYPGKFFEYLRSHRTIFAIGSPGEIADSLAKSGAGILVPHDDTQAIKDSIKELLAQKDLGKLNRDPNEEHIQSYEYRNLTEKLVGVLEKSRTR